MDQCMVDVSSLLEVKIGDEVVLWGRQGQEGKPWKSKTMLGEKLL